MSKTEKTEECVRIVSQFTRLRKSGAYYVGLCPFHREKTPSFLVSPKHYRYFCLGCGVNGLICDLEHALGGDRA